MQKRLKKSSIEANIEYFEGQVEKYEQMVIVAKILLDAEIKKLEDEYPVGTDD